MIGLSPGAEPSTRLMADMADYARRIEAAGFPGIWVGDSMGRGRPTLAAAAPPGRRRFPLNPERHRRRRRAPQ